jgi:urea transport system substrate-binding protein
MGLRILVVEDEPTILDLVAQLLVEEGHQVTRAANGADGLDAVSAGPAFDLVVLDMWMPVVNGWQFAAALGERGVEVPLLVMTAASEARARAIDVGAVGFIGKPFDVDQLVRAVRTAVPSSDGERGGNTAPIRPADAGRRPPSTIARGHFRPTGP